MSVVGVRILVLEKLKERKTMSDYLDYLDEIYEELVDEFGHEIESNCIHE